MNKLGCLIGMFISCGVCSGQNLVPNGDFELYSTCPNLPGQLDSCLFWTTPSSGSSDYLNQCASPQWVGVPVNFFGSQNAHGGAAYSGIYLFNAPNYREYIEAHLTIPLIAGTCYHLEMYVSLAEACQYTTDDISAYFSDTLIKNLPYFNLNFTPQINNTVGNFPDSSNWITVSGNYLASGGEQYLIIGNFNDDANTDTVLVHPSALQNRAYIYIDDVSLTPCTTGINETDANIIVSFFPNPFNDKINITTKRNELVEVNLFDITARKIFNQSFRNSILINTEQLAKGLYLYEVRNKNGVIKKGKVVKD